MEHNKNGSKIGSILAQNNQGLSLCGILLHFTRFRATYEFHNPPVVWQVSEVIPDLKVYLGDRQVYQGKAVLSSVVHIGTTVICEASLEDAWRDVDLNWIANQGQLRAEFRNFVQSSQKVFRIAPEFKLLVADAHALFNNLRLWLEELELGLRGAREDAANRERELLLEIRNPVTDHIDAFWSRFEPLAKKVEENLRPAHRVYLRRQLHPLVLCSPFAYRTYAKPLGYAGDYEIVNMIVRPPEQGSSLFAKLVNIWLLQQPPAEAHRNRLQFLGRRLIEETVRVRTEAKRKARIFSLGCGPAAEVQEFIAEQELSNHADFTLVDFSEEALAFANRTLADFARRHSRQVNFATVKKSVQQFLKETARSAASEPKQQYDFVYCAGLFDYLPDQVCQRLVSLCYQWLHPGGLLLVTNVADTKPFLTSMDYLLDWHLICRSATDMRELAPEGSASECVVQSDLTGVNLFMEVRKPAHA